MFRAEDGGDNILGVEHDRIMGKILRGVGESCTAWYLRVAYALISEYSPVAM